MVSWRNVKKGSWFIQALVYTFCKNAHLYDLQRLMTMVRSIYICIYCFLIFSSLFFIPLFKRVCHEALHHFNLETPVCICVRHKASTDSIQGNRSYVPMAIDIKPQQIPSTATRLYLPMDMLLYPLIIFRDQQS